MPPFNRMHAADGYQPSVIGLSVGGIVIACRHLITTQHGHQDLRDLQLRELDVSQMISDHEQHWTLDALQVDWNGYCLQM